VTGETLIQTIRSDHMSRIQASPYVNFQGRAREAMELYRRVLGGTVQLWTAGGQGESRPAGPGDRIGHCRLESDGAVIVGSDGHPDYPAKAGDSMAIAVSGTDRDRLTGIFNGLAAGGRIQMPLARQTGGAEVGWLADRFGIHWTISIEGRA
jgi:PhnB protein